MFSEFIIRIDAITGPMDTIGSTKYASYFYENAPMQFAQMIWWLIAEEQWICKIYADIISAGGIYEENGHANSI